MIFEEIPLNGVWLIRGSPFSDERGSFWRHYCRREFEEHGIAAEFVQTSISVNPLPRTLRGFHYQKSPHGESKIISPLTGSIHDIVVDLRPDSETYLKWHGLDLEAASFESVFIPVGCAHAYVTLQEDTVVLYYMSEFFSPEHYTGLRYNDPRFGFRWPVEPEHISEKDRSYPDFDPDTAPLK